MTRLMTYFTIHIDDERGQSGCFAAGSKQDRDKLLSSNFVTLR